MGAGVIGTYLGVVAVVLWSWCVVMCTVCQFPTGVVFRMGLGRVNGRKEQRVRVASALFRDKLPIYEKKLFASSWYIFLTYIYDARSHLHQNINLFRNVSFNFNPLRTG